MDISRKDCELVDNCQSERFKILLLSKIKMKVPMFLKVTPF